MSEHPKGLLNSLGQKLALRRWAATAQCARDLSLSALRRERSNARKLRQHLDALMFVADERLMLPAEGASAMQLPHNCDWSWRPELWRGRIGSVGMSAVQTKSMLGSEVTLFHDCQISELTLRQLRNTREGDLAPYGVRMDVFRFDGSYLSLVVDLPEDASEGLQKRHILGLEAIISTESPIEIFARLNIKNGPNAEQIVRELSASDGRISAEFDLAYTNLNEKRIDKLWLDLIFEGPEMNQVTLHDLVFSRRPRADL